MNKLYIRTYANNRWTNRILIHGTFTFHYWSTILFFIGDAVIVDYNNLIHLKIK